MLVAALYSFGHGLQGREGHCFSRAADGLGWVRLAWNEGHGAAMMALPLYRQRQEPRNAGNENLATLVLLSINIRITVARLRGFVAELRGFRGNLTTRRKALVQGFMVLRC